ncbi:hypothetical protein [Shimazuella kribbensis]|uniref:hypothetical protein n=1 Tax=Shimazuella kribbensis TaxID=139808 RepID=UPI00040C4CCF|nr:hypothetical protein [Shimazuella kribbensis]
MGLIVRRNKKKLALLVLGLLTLVVAMIPTTEAFASYQPVLNKQFMTYNTTEAFKYIRGGLGIKVYCKNTKGAYHTMFLQRKMPTGKWENRGVRTIYCNKGSFHYNYFYISNTVSGQYYRLHFANSKEFVSTTTLKVEVNPN